MDIQPIYKGEEIKNILNQRDPILMVDALYSASENEGIAGLTVEAKNIFCQNGRLNEPGLIEHIAQSASAFVGYKAVRESVAAPVGYIGEVKKFKVLETLPKVGDKIVTTIKIMSVVMNITLFSAESKVGDVVVATCQMKLSV